MFTFIHIQLADTSNCQYPLIRHTTALAWGFALVLMWKCLLPTPDLLVLILLLAYRYVDMELNPSEDTRERFMQLQSICTFVNYTTLVWLLSVIAAIAANTNNI